jgi:hypothetical protein
MRTGCSFGSDRATDATASSHFAAGRPVQSILGVADGSAGAAPPQAATNQAATSTATQSPPARVTR